MTYFIGGKTLLTQNKITIIFFIDYRLNMSKGVTLWFGSIFDKKKSLNQWNFQWFGFYCFWKKKPNQTNRFGLDWIGWSVCLKIQLKKNLYFHKFVFHAYNILKYFTKLCFPCSLFFKQLCVTNMKN